MDSVRRPIPHPPDPVAAPAVAAIESVEVDGDIHFRSGAPFTRAVAAAAAAARTCGA